MSAKNKKNIAVIEYNAKLFSEFNKLVQADDFEAAYKFQLTALDSIQAHLRRKKSTYADNHMLNAYGVFISERVRPVYFPENGPILENFEKWQSEAIVASKLMSVVDAVSRSQRTKA